MTARQGLTSAKSTGRDYAVCPARNYELIWCNLESQWFQEE